MRTMLAGIVAVSLWSVVVVADVSLKAGAATVTVGKDGQIKDIRAMADKAVLAHVPHAPFLSIRRGSKRVSPSDLQRKGDQLIAQFADPALTLKWQLVEKPDYLALHLREVVGNAPDQVEFLAVMLSPKAKGWCVSTVALNQDTNALGLPGRNPRGQAAAFKRLGLTRGAAALVIAPVAQLPESLKAVVSDAPDLPHSPVGGPWALGAPTARGSYLFAPRNVSEKTVDEVIELADRLGLSQINLHAARFGDWQPYPNVYPEGRKSLKRVIDRIHAAGMQAGIHTYCYFLDKRTPYVTPIPDPRLAKDAVFTLAEDLPAKGTTVKVLESTASMSAITGFFERNSATVQIGNELIVYRVVRKEAPFAFVECKRGANGTKVAAHAKGAKVHHLRECFGLFLPDGDSTLFAEVAANLAGLINECGFDMVYLDALDGSDVVAGSGWSWHYAAKFTFELFRNIKRPVLAEMSTFPHHQWFVRSRAGAWDHPVRSHKAFIETHCQANRNYERHLLPTHLGWWQYKTWHDFATEPTFADDIDYLCGKSLGFGAGISVQGVSPATLDRVPALSRMSAISRRWENLRRAGYFTDAVRKQLRVRGAEFTLAANEQGEWDLVPRQAPSHRVSGAKDGSNRWQVANPFAEQPLAFRLEPLATAQAKSAGTARGLVDLATDKALVFKARQGMKVTCEASALRTPDGQVAARLQVADPGKQSNPWAHWQRNFDPPLDLRAHQAIGLWVHGDGKGEVLNIKLQSPKHLSRAAGEHYVVIDFTGWRWIELIEPEGERYLDYRWPHRGWYSVFRQSKRQHAVSRVSAMLANLPKGQMEIHIGPVQGIPLAMPALDNLQLTVNGTPLALPFTARASESLELDPTGWLRLFDGKGKLLRTQRMAHVPLLRAGANDFAFACAPPLSGERARAKVTVFATGVPLPNARATAPTWPAQDRDVEPPHTILAGDGEQNRWRFSSRVPSPAASLELRLQALALGDHPARHAGKQAIVLDDLASLAAFADSPTNQFRQFVRSGKLVNIDALPGVSHTLAPLARAPGNAGVLYTAKSPKAGGWCARGRRFAPPLNLSAATHLGFWLKGDGLGEVLYLQLRDPKGRNLDFKTTVDFVGWRYVEFPMVAGDFDLAHTEYAILYYNGLPAGREVACGIDDIRAFTVRSSLRNLVIQVNGQSLRLAGDMPAGTSLRYHPSEGCAITAADGSKKTVAATGNAPLFQGWNEIDVQADGTAELALNVTLIKHYAPAKR